MTNELQGNIERSFLMLLGMVLFICICWLTYKLAAISIVVLTLLPIVKFWLWKFHQNRIKQSVMHYLIPGFLLITVFCALFLMLRAQHFETKVDEFFLEGKTKSKMVTEESIEEPVEVTERRYSFFLKDRKDEWKKKLIEWYIVFLIFGSPILTIYLIPFAEPIYKEKKKKE